MRESRWAFTPYIWVVKVCGYSNLPLKQLRLRVRAEATLLGKPMKLTESIEANSFDITVKSQMLFLADLYRQTLPF